MLRALDRVELYVILCSDDVYTQETPGTIVRPEIPYEDVSIAGDYSLHFYKLYLFRPY